MMLKAEKMFVTQLAVNQETSKIAPLVQENGSQHGDTSSK